jgi:uncharacterized membrane protein
MIDMKQSILIVSVVLSMLIFSGNAHAVALQYYGIEDTINDDFSVTNNVVLKFNTSINHLDYSLDFKVEDLEFESDFEFSDCRVTDNNGGSTISCDFIGITPEKNKLTLTFITRDVIQKVGDNYRFTVNYGIPLPIESNFVIIRLPQNNILAGQANESFFPSTGGTLTDGRHIMVFWEEENLETGENLQYSILFTRPPFGAEFLNFLIYAFIIGAIVATAIIAIYIRRTRKSKIAVVKTVLNKDEKRIIDILSQKDGRAGQKIIVRETDFSKAKVSRIVKGLRDRGVVDTEPISGRENRVILKFGETPKKKEQE